MKKLLILLLLINSLSILGEEANTYAIKYNSEISKNEIWLIKSDGTYEKLIDFAFPSGFWTPATSYASDKDGKLYLKDSGSGISEEEKGWVVYDPTTNTITTGIKDGYNEGFQKVFSDVLKIDSLIKNETDDLGDKSSVIGTDELVASSGTTIIANGTDSEDGSATTVIGSNDIVGSDGDTLISKEADGSVHIGENSLVTVEENGVQQLYATDANDDMININIKKGTDLLIDGVSVAGSLSTNATNIATNTTDVATNKTSIAANTADIATNKTSIATNTTDISSNKTSIVANTTNIAANTAEIATYTDSIASNTTAIAAIGSDLSTFKASANSQMNYMKSDYSSGIASAVAMSQFNLAQDGFSIGVGRGSYNDENETAFGLGYGGEFKNGTLFKLQASKSGDASGVGLTISF
jgi:hypothetical protein